MQDIDIDTDNYRVSTVIRKFPLQSMWPSDHLRTTDRNSAHTITPNARIWKLKNLNDET